MKRLFIIVLSILLFSYPLNVFAAASVPVSPCGSGIDTTGRFTNLCKESATATPGHIIQNLLIIMMLIAAVLALVFLIWGGIKWIMSGGDKTKVESARNTIIAAVVGLILTLLSFFILSIFLGLFGLSFSSLSLPRFDSCPPGTISQGLGMCF